MTIEKSHGKARPTLPRASDLQSAESVGNRSDGRTAGGRFAGGNRLSVDARQKSTIKRMLGSGAGDEVALAVARDALRLFGGFMRDMPSDGFQVRELVALEARHAAVAGFWAARAAELGLDTPEGKEADDRAMKHGQRVERLAVTALDVARVVNEQKKRIARVDPQAVMRARLEARAAAREADIPPTEVLS